MALVPACPVAWGRVALLPGGFEAEAETALEVFRPVSVLLSAARRQSAYGWTLHPRAQLDKENAALV